MAESNKTNPSYRTFDVEPLRAAIRLIVRGFGSSDTEVDLVANNLIEANLTGHDSHGIGMLPRYVEAYQQRGLMPNQHVRTMLDHGTTLRLDGGAGFGQVIGHEAMQLGIDRARQHGSCIVALGNSHHLGRIGAWAEQAAQAGLISIHFVNVVARSIVAPYAGADARFGTNPFTAGIPFTGHDPVILDFATSVLAQGKTRVAFNKGELVPPDCLLDDRGAATREPRYAVNPPFGAILAFGQHKGYGLALICELLGGALAAGVTQRSEDETQRRILNGMLSVLIDPSALADRAAFEHEALAFIDWVKASPAREGFGAVKVAGEPERETRVRRTASGIPVDQVTWSEILDAAGKLGVDRMTVNNAPNLLD
ncbi:MAG: malate/lactate/ureidoglycolate dehydrogenase [Burkholderiaceae bacterium]